LTNAGLRVRRHQSLDRPRNYRLLPDTLRLPREAWADPTGSEICWRSDRIPAIYTISLFAEAGGLASYGVDLPDQFGRGATYVDRIFRGTRPTDLPVQQPTKFKLVINLKTAKALGLTVPETLLATADEVIE
jgi:hypothetical protein